jgi:hypothetical protein
MVYLDNFLHCRIAVIGMYGLLVIGPTFHWWYGKLEELSQKLPERFRFISKLLLDRVVFTPPFLVVTLLYRKLFENTPMTQKLAELKRIILPILIVNWKVCAMCCYFCCIIRHHYLSYSRCGLLCRV